MIGSELEGKGQLQKRWPAHQAISPFCKVGGQDRRTAWYGQKDPQTEGLPSRGRVSGRPLAKAAQ